MQLRFIYQSIKEEEEIKLRSYLESYENLENSLITYSRNFFDEEKMQKVERIKSFVKNINSNCNDHPCFRIYLTHPYRVAYYAIRLSCNPSVDLFTLGVLHNVYEVTGLLSEDLKKNSVNPKVANAIKLLTIVRKNESDPSYLADFYGAIEAHSSDLALIRCVDKLDNLLGTAIIEDDYFKKSYIDLAEQFVAPMAMRLNKEFGDYFYAICEYMKGVSFRPNLKKSLDDLITKSRGGK